MIRWWQIDFGAELYVEANEADGALEKVAVIGAEEVAFGTRLTGDLRLQDFDTKGYYGEAYGLRSRAFALVRDAAGSGEAPLDVVRVDGTRNRSGTSAPVSDLLPAGASAVVTISEGYGEGTPEEGVKAQIYVL